MLRDLIVNVMIVICLIIIFVGTYMGVPQNG